MKKVLIYKRTHKHDPDYRGIFGNQNCMKSIRNWNYDAVIGIGGKSAWKEDRDIRLKINWIGLEPKKVFCHKWNNSIVVFEHFALFEEKGENIEEHYPYLYDYMYERGNLKRFDMSSHNDTEVYKEVKAILQSVESFPASKAYNIEDCKDNFDTCIQTNTEHCGWFMENKEAAVSCRQENSICKREHPEPCSGCH